VVIMQYATNFAKTNIAQNFVISSQNIAHTALHHG